MNKILKRLACGFISLSMLCMTAVIPVSAQDIPSDGLLMNITFDETGTGSGSFTATAGGTVTEHGAISYTDSYDGSSKALSITTDAAGNYLELPKGILNGKEAATFAFWIKPQSHWAFMTTPVSGAQDYLNEKYVGMLASPSGFTLERYNNSGSRLSSVTANGTYMDWQYVVAVCEAGGSKVYVNGKLCASDTAAVDIKSLMTADAQTWIGHGNWGSGEGFSGKMDDFCIYGRALSDEEITVMSAKGAELEKQRVVSEYNSFISETHFYDADNNEIFSLGKNSENITETIKAEVNIKNYTEADSDYTLDVYSVRADGTKKGLLEFPDVVTTIASGEEINIPLTINTSDIISDCEKLAVRIHFVRGDIEQEAVLYTDITAPVAAPADSNSTTNGAHDPSIVKFEGDDNYYVYSSHHLIFTSKDLINWTKYDFTGINAKDISPKTYNFISGNYSNTSMNGTYWAPDVIYKEGDEHPYWMYISVSCGLGGRNSVISLMKSDSPLFWADENAEIIDAGIVFATKEASGYKTNSIDANIYTDTDGQQYFIWGSFWGGIQAAKLKADGFVEGIDYTSDSTILNTCKNFGTSVFTQKNGVAGPEGAWMINHGDYRYMFTSYGWLGSNYNTRVAKASHEQRFSDNMGTQLTDANGVVMGTQQSAGSTSKTTGYKLIGSYRLGDGSMDITTCVIGDATNYHIERTGGDAHVYYGPGHNSAIETEDGQSFYISHVRKDEVEGAAVLQARKMLWTADGWPVVSPVTYAGEVEQSLPKDMICGTYDLASVGQTKMIGKSINSSGNLINRNYDLPVLSSKVTLNPDGTMADGLGTWEFDGDHTVTLKFAKDGDISKDEFYKNGDVMTMFALFGYDKDEAKSVIALTGTDENHITQFAKKILNSFTSKIEIKTTPTVIKKSEKGNPIFGLGTDGKITYGGDPSVLVDGDTVYVYAGHDTSTTNDYVIPEYICYSSKDLVSWDYHGSVFTVNKTTVPWASGSNSAWASQVLKHNGKYYLYYCTWGSSTYSGYQCIGAAVSDSPTGPFTNLSKTPLINGKTMTAENTSAWNDIDPTGWIETDENGVEHIYLNWGNSENYTCELNDDMISVKDINGDGQITSADIKHTTFNGLEGTYTEAPYLYRRTDENGNYTGKYYLFFAKDWREQWAYATSDDIMSGSWDYRSLVMEPTATSNTSHGAIFDFNGKTYFLYHNGSLPHGSGYRRVANIQEMTFEGENVVPMTELSTGISGTASLIFTDSGKYIGHEPFSNPLDDASYPLLKPMTASSDNSDYNTRWEIEKGKADSSNESYVSIQAVNKPGLYITASGSDIILTQQDTASEELAERMTFKTVEAINGDSSKVSFESVSSPGRFLTVSGSSVTLSGGSNPDSASFNIVDFEVGDASYENGTLSFSITSAALSDTVTAYIAEYKDGALENVRIENVPINAVTNKVELPYEPSENSDKVKLFVWRDISPLAPITDLTSLVIK